MNSAEQAASLVPAGSQPAVLIGHGKHQAMAEAIVMSVTLATRCDKTYLHRIPHLHAARRQELFEQGAEVQANIVTFIAAGHETTANALTWTWHLLSQHPDAEARLHAELDSVLGGRSPSPDDLPRLAWTRAVMAESMRLRPPSAVEVPRAARNVSAASTSAQS